MKNTFMAVSVFFFGLTYMPTLQAMSFFKKNNSASTEKAIKPAATVITFINNTGDGYSLLYKNLSNSEQVLAYELEPHDKPQEIWLSGNYLFAITHPGIVGTLKISNLSINLSGGNTCFVKKVPIYETAKTTPKNPMIMQPPKKVGYGIELSAEISPGGGLYFREIFPLHTSTETTSDSLPTT